MLTEQPFRDLIRTLRYAHDFGFSFSTRNSGAGLLAYLTLVESRDSMLRAHRAQGRTAAIFG